MTRHTPAPSEALIAISFCRCKARQSSKLPASAHAISRTNPTAATIKTKLNSYFRVTSSRHGETTISSPALSIGFSLSI
jgi:hypothetical protein